jgi:agmatinase
MTQQDGLGGANYVGQFAYAQNGNRFLAVPAGMGKPFCVAGVPYDGAVTNRPGARFGPQEIRRASLMLCDGVHPYFDVSPVDALCDAGDMRLPNTSLATARAAIEQQAAALIKQHHCVFLGGDHSITLALLRAHRTQQGKPLALVHFDAHCDTWTDHFGEPSGHGTWTSEAIQEGLVDVASTVQLGIRSAGAREAREYVQDQGGAIYTARALRGLVSVEQLKPVVDAIRARIGNRPCYLTLDIDCLDPAFAPGTGTPEPGGLSSGQVLTLLEELAPLNFVGMDCNEVSPPYDHAELTSQAAASFVWTYLCGRVAQGAK